MLSELGVILLLFEVGLHTTIPDMLRVGGSAFLVAVLGVVVPFFLGWGVGAYFLPQAESLVRLRKEIGADAPPQEKWNNDP